jgi:hypothetical protein
MAALFDGVDWEVVCIFAALVLLEGLRRIPAGALVVSSLGWSDWKPAGEPEPRARWRLVSYWPPLASALVLLPLGGGATVSTTDLCARLEVARRARPWLAAGGALTLAALMLGLPLASARLGGVGFLGGATLVLSLALATALAGGSALRRLDIPPRARRIQMLKWCSPFASGRVLEGVYEAALAGASPAQALRTLAGDEVFAGWARPRAYDVVHAGAADPDLAAAADAATLSAILASVPRMDEGGRSYCPRCGATWSREEGSCSACAVPLVRLRS